MKKTLPIFAAIAGVTALVLYKIKKDEKQRVTSLDDGLELDDDYVKEHDFSVNGIKEQTIDAVEKIGESIKDKVKKVSDSVNKKSEIIIEDANDLSEKIVNRVEKFDENYTHLLEEEVTKIKNAADELIKDLKKQGDVHSIERPIQHHIIFKDSESLQAFKSEIINKGFVVTNGEKEYELYVLHISPLEGSFFDNLLFIANITKAHLGTYIGWNTQAMH